jgi:hypothetical protein
MCAEKFLLIFTVLTLLLMLENTTLPDIHIGRYIDPLSDFGFKLIFGSEPNKDLLIAFLNELFKEENILQTSRTTKMKTMAHRMNTAHLFMI